MFWEDFKDFCKVVFYSTLGLALLAVFALGAPNFCAKAASFNEAAEYPHSGFCHESSTWNTLPPVERGEE